MGLSEFTLSVVRRVPEQLEYGILYVCFECNVVVHLCACGCGEKVVLPISPSCWSIEYNGEAVSMKPSIGNFQTPCRSHYWINRNKVVWAKDSVAPSTKPNGRKKQSRHYKRWIEKLKHIFKGSSDKKRRYHV